MASVVWVSLNLAAIDGEPPSVWRTTQAYASLPAMPFILDPAVAVASRI
jgi:hypothetical protein